MSFLSFHEWYKSSYSFFHFQWNFDEKIFAKHWKMGIEWIMRCIHMKHDIISLVSLSNLCKPPVSFRHADAEINISWNFLCNLLPLTQFLVTPLNTPHVTIMKEQLPPSNPPKVKKLVIYKLSVKENIVILNILFLWNAIKQKRNTAWFF